MQIQTANSRGAVVSALQAMVKGAWVLRVERPSLSSSLWLSLSSSASSHLFAVSIIKPALARLRAHMHAHTQVRTTASPRQGISGAEADQLWMWSSCLLFCSWGGEQTRMNFYPSPLKSLISAPVSYHFSLFEGQFILKNIKLLKKKKQGSLRSCDDGYQRTWRSHMRAERCSTVVIDNDTVPLCT